LKRKKRERGGSAVGDKRRGRGNKKEKKEVFPLWEKAQQGCYRHLAKVRKEKKLGSIEKWKRGNKSKDRAEVFGKMWIFNPQNGGRSMSQRKPGKRCPSLRKRHPCLNGCYRQRKKG